MLTAQQSPFLPLKKAYKYPWHFFFVLKEQGENDQRQKNTLKTQKTAKRLRDSEACFRKSYTAQQQEGGKPGQQKAR